MNQTETTSHGGKKRGTECPGTRVVVRSRAGGGRQQRNGHTPPHHHSSSSPRRRPVQFPRSRRPRLPRPAHPATRVRPPARAAVPASRPVTLTPCTREREEPVRGNQAAAFAGEIGGLDMEAAAGGAGLTRWQAAALAAVAGWVWAASFYDLTRRARALVQPWVTRRVHAETEAILRFQRSHHKLLDDFFSVLSCVVSVPFYTGFLPLLFWSGHGRLARQMTLLMAFCDYLGNSVKDIVSAPRPCSPPVRRVTATEDEKENAMEYGLPSSHALNTVCLMGYLLHYVLTYGEHGSVMIAAGLSLAFLLVMLVGIARIYLGMHSLTDVIAGIGFGVVILAFWLIVHDHVDAFVVSGQNVATFWAGLSLLMCFAYPKPEFPTPSFEYHTAFNGVAFGIVYGIQQTYFHFHTPDAPLIFSTQLPLLAFAGRVLAGIPTILVVKFCSKALSKWLLPVMCSTLGIPIVSSCYVPALKIDNGSKNKADTKQTAGYLQRLFSYFPQKAYDVDTGIRFVQYASLAWSVVDLVPAIFTHLNL